MIAHRLAPRALGVLRRLGFVVIAVQILWLGDARPAYAELVVCNLPTGQTVTIPRSSCRQQIGLVIRPVGSAPGAPEEPRVPQPIGSGSGVVVNGQGDVVTNHHVIEQCEAVLVHYEQGAWTDAEVVSRDAVQDLALLRTALAVRQPATLRSSPPVRPAEQVVATGFPLSNALGTDDITATFGAVGSVDGLTGHGHLMTVTALLRPGNSGGPILDMGGNVIGVGTRIFAPSSAGRSRDTAPDYTGVAVRSDAIIPFLSRNAVPFAPGAFSRHLGPSSVAELARQFTVRVVCLGER